jgi:succinate dehydrogenase / fumarate reductase, cytochrome b subunit
MPPRPLSPHLQVYKLTYTMVTSGLHRISGVGLSVGLLLLVYWLMAVAGGARSYARALGVLSSLPAKAVYAGLVLAFCYHLAAGMRHLIWDTGRGLERAQLRSGAIAVIAVSIVLALVIGYCLWAAGARAA